MNYKIAKVRFIDGFNDKEYSFRLYDTYGETLAGDVVVVDSQFGKQLGQITAIIPQEEYEGTTPYKDIICTVNQLEYQNYLNRKEEHKRKNHLKKELKQLLFIILILRPHRIPRPHHRKGRRRCRPLYRIRHRFQCSEAQSPPHCQ